MTQRGVRHQRRSVRSLDGFWAFAFLGDADVDRVDVSAIVFDDLMVVPGCYDATPRYAGRRGVAAYRLVVPVTPGRRHQLHLGSVQFWSRVFVDGRQVAEQPLGYSPFHATFTPAQPICHIVVLADNRFHQRNHLQFAGYDWYQFGGIDRSVELHEMGDVWIDGVQVQTLDAASGRMRLRLDVGGADPTSPLRVFWRDHRLFEGPSTPSIDLQLPGAQPWSPQQPVLHELRLELGDDDWIQRVGLRDIRARDEQLLLNGKPVRLWGVNYHHIHPQSGSAISDQTLLADLQLIRDMGCNFVRMAHYPPDARALDLCDELGLLVWAEGLGWGLRDVELQHPDLSAAALTHLDALASAVTGHPSVIIAGYFNECGSESAGSRDMYQRMAGRLRTLLPDCLISYATNKPMTDNCLDLVDVVALNTYPGWYHGSLATMEANLRDELAALRARPGAAGKPVMISEIGAEGLRGHRDWHDQRWSERYQAQMLLTAWRTTMQGPRPLAGFTVWQFCDVRTSTEPRMMMGRPRGHNNKGLVDEHRVPKLSYDMLQAEYRAMAAEQGR
jgi:beta-glucuronidase